MSPWGRFLSLFFFLFSFSFVHAQPGQSLIVRTYTTALSQGDYTRLVIRDDHPTILVSLSSNSRSIPILPVLSSESVENESEYRFSSILHPDKITIRVVVQDTLNNLTVSFFDTNSKNWIPAVLEPTDQ